MLIDGTAEYSGQWLENLDRTHLRPTGGKSVPQKVLKTIPYLIIKFESTHSLGGCSVVGAMTSIVGSKPSLFWE